MVKLSENMVLGKTRATELSNVKKLNCWASDLSDISVVRRMINCQVLSLSVNNIETLDDFSYCESLEELYIRKNLVRDLEEVKHLQSLPNLRILWLSENPCAESPDYRATVIRYLPNLKTLDNIQIEEQERRMALAAETATNTGSPDILEAAENARNTDCGRAERDLSAVPFNRPSDASKPIENGHNSRISSANRLHDDTPQHDVNALRKKDGVVKTSNYSANLTPASFAHEFGSSSSDPVMNDHIPVRNERVADMGDMNNRCYTPPSASCSYLGGRNEEGRGEERSTRSSREGWKDIAEPGFVRSSGAAGATGKDLYQDSTLQTSSQRTNANVLQAVLCLLNELDATSLEIVSDAVRNRCEALNLAASSESEPQSYEDVA